MIQESVIDKITFAFNVFVLYFVWMHSHWSVALILTLYCAEPYIDKVYKKAKEWAGVEE